MLQRTIWLAMILVGVAAGTGCERPAPETPEEPAGPDVLLVDARAVAQALGRVEEMQARMEEVNQQIRQQIEQRLNQLQQQLQQAVEEAGEQVSDEERQRIAQLRAEAQQRVQALQAQAQQTSQQAQLALTQQFRDQLRPIAERIARQRGAKAVTLQLDTWLWFDAEVDITDEVIAAMRDGAAGEDGAGNGADDAGSQADPGATEAE
jgi:Skp family chaperone for outer membrane proteins